MYDVNGDCKITKQELQTVLYQIARKNIAALTEIQLQIIIHKMIEELNEESEQKKYDKCNACVDGFKTLRNRKIPCSDCTMKPGQVNFREFKSIFEARAKKEEQKKSIKQKSQSSSQPYADKQTKKRGKTPPPKQTMQQQMYN